MGKLASSCRSFEKISCTILPSDLASNLCTARVTVIAEMHLPCRGIQEEGSEGRHCRSHCWCTVPTPLKGIWALVFPAVEKRLVAGMHMVARYSFFHYRLPISAKLIHW